MVKKTTPNAITNDPELNEMLQETFDRAGTVRTDRLAKELLDISRASGMKIYNEEEVRAQLGDEGANTLGQWLDDLLKSDGQSAIPSEEVMRLINKLGSTPKEIDCGHTLPKPRLH